MLSLALNKRDLCFIYIQTRCLIKAGYMLEFAQQPHAAMKSYITAWQLLTGCSQMAPALERMTVCNLISVRMYPMYFKAKEPYKAAHHAREHRAVLRENPPGSPLQGYLLPLWLAQLHQLLAQLCEDAMQLTPSALDTHDVWQLAGFHYQAAARYLHHVRTWIRTAKALHPPPSMKGGLAVPSQWLGRPDTLQVSPVKIGCTALCIKLVEAQLRLSGYRNMNTAFSFMLLCSWL